MYYVGLRSIMIIQSSPLETNTLCRELYLVKLNPLVDLGIE